VFRPGSGNVPGAGVAAAAGAGGGTGTGARGAVISLDPPGLDLGQVEDVVDQGEQVLAGRVDLLQVGQERLPADLFGLLLEELAVADYGVEGRAQLMAHVGDELAFGPAGGLGGIAGDRQLLVGLLQLRRALPDAPLQVLVELPDLLQGGEHDDRQVAQAVVGLEPLQDLEAVARGHDDVEQDHVERPGPDQFQGLAAVGRRGHVMAQAAQPAVQQIPVDLVVVHHQEGALPGGGGLAARAGARGHAADHVPDHLRQGGRARRRVVGRACEVDQVVQARQQLPAQGAGPAQVVGEAVQQHFPGVLEPELMASAVRAITGMARVSSAALSRRVTSQPSITGMCMSIRMRSGRSVRALSAASAPSTAQTT
jgi:hypothetical protein